MKQAFNLRVDFNGSQFVVQVAKYSSFISNDFVISVYDPQLYKLSGVKEAIFNYENDDNNYERPKVYYSHLDPDAQLCNIPFEQSIAEAIKFHECIYSW